MLVELRCHDRTGSLLEALQDDHSRVPSEAAVALARLRDPEAIGPLTEMLRNANAATRTEAVWTLGEIRAETAVPALGSMVRATDPAAWVPAVPLGKLGPEESVESLLEGLIAANRQLPPALKEDDDEVRLWAREALERLGDAGTAPFSNGSSLSTHDLSAYRRTRFPTREEFLSRDQLCTFHSPDSSGFSISTSIISLFVSNPEFCK